MGGRGLSVECLEVRSLLSAGAVALPESAGDRAPGSAVVAPLSAGAAASEPDEGGVTLGEFAGVRFTARLGEFHFKTVDQSLNAVIDWGDGTHSDGQVVGSYATGEWYVRGTHTYAHTGTYQPDVKVFSHLVGNPNGPTGTIAEINDVVNVRKALPSPGGRTLTEPAGKPFTARLGEFTKKVVDLTLDAVINWGDGTKSAGKLVGSYATGEYYVEGTHTYATAGTYKVDVKVYAHPVGSPILPTTPVARFRSWIKVTG